MHIPIVIYESAKLKLGINKSSIKSVTLPSLKVIKLYPLSPKFPIAPPRIKVENKIPLYFFPNY